MKRIECESSLPALKLSYNEVMERSLLWIITPFTIGILAIFIYSQIVARKEFKLRKKGYKPRLYQDKLPQEYTKKQKRFTLIIALFLLLIVSFVFYFLLNRQLLYANSVIFLGLVAWRLLIKVGNRVK